MSLAQHFVNRLTLAFCPIECGFEEGTMTCGVSGNSKSVHGATQSYFTKEEMTRVPAILRVRCGEGVCAVVLLAAMLVLLGCQHPLEPSRADRLTDDPALGPKNAPVT